MGKYWELGPLLEERVGSFPPLRPSGTMFPNTSALMMGIEMGKMGNLLEISLETRGGLPRRLVVVH